MDPYVYPGTSVLRNLRDPRSAEELAKFEARASGSRLLALAEAPVEGQFDTTHLCAIHGYIFQDV